MLQIIKQFGKTKNIYNKFGNKILDYKFELYFFSMFGFLGLHFLTSSDIFLFGQTYCSYRVMRLSIQQ